MTGRLEGKVAVITGAGGGVGRATAELFVEEGAAVALLDVDEDAANATADVIATAGGRALAIRAALNMEAEAERAINETADHFGRIDVLANVAGVRVSGRITDATAESWEFIVGGNLLAPAYCAKFAIPHMINSGGGSIINVASSNAIQGRPKMAQYDATKSALLALSRDMAWDHAEDNIRVNVLCPGRVLTPYHVKNAAKRHGISFDDAEEKLRTAGVDNIIGRHSEPREIAYGILFLASGESSYVTGTNLIVDGGVTA